MRISDWSSDVCSSDLRLSRTGGSGRQDRSDRTGGRSGAQRARGAAAFPPRPFAGGVDRLPPAHAQPYDDGARLDRQGDVVGTSVYVRVDIGGCRIIYKKKNEVQ